MRGINVDCMMTYAKLLNGEVVSKKEQKKLETLIKPEILKQRIEETKK